MHALILSGQILIRVCRLRVTADGLKRIGTVDDQCEERLVRDRFGHAARQRIITLLCALLHRLDHLRGSGRHEVVGNDICRALQRRQPFADTIHDVDLILAWVNGVHHVNIVADEIVHTGTFAARNGQNAKAVELNRERADTAVIQAEHHRKAIAHIASVVFLDIGAVEHLRDQWDPLCAAARIPLPDLRGKDAHSIDAVDLALPGKRQITLALQMRLVQFDQTTAVDIVNTLAAVVKQ